MDELLDFVPNPEALIGWLSDLGLQDPEYCATKLNGYSFGYSLIFYNNTLFVYLVSVISLS
jgi:hypothetical protein